jgi:hypothetical protein
MLSELLTIASLTNLLVGYVIYPSLRNLAWKIEIKNRKELENLHPKTVKNEWIFSGRAPGYDARGWYQVLVHTPIYIYKFTFGILRFPFEILRRMKMPNSPETPDLISDLTIFNFCTKTSLVILGRFENGEFIFEMTPSRCPLFKAVGDCDPSSLKIRFRGTYIQEATSLANGTIQGNQYVSRNEILISSLRYILSNWLHTTAHVAAEKSALEIQEKRIQELEPSAHFVTSLHEGLLHGLFSPLNPMSPIYCGQGGPDKMLSDCLASPMPNHIIQHEKNVLEVYEFLMFARCAIFKLVRKYNLPVDSENLFLNIILHGIDHEMCYRVLSELPLISIDGSGSLWSWWQSYNFVHIWLRHVDNPWSSDLLVNHLQYPFYRELYESLSKINKPLANEIVVCCSF